MWNDDNGWHDGPGGWWWLFMLLMMVAFWGGLAWLIVTLVRHGPGARPTDVQQHPQPQSAEDLLRERLARGEIDVDEYHQRLEALRTTRGP